MAIQIGSGANDPAREQHLIETLAKDSAAPVDRVRQLYEAEHARLSAEARVKTFVSVIATRLVRNALQGDHQPEAD